MHNRLHYLTLSKILVEYQFGFRQGHAKYMTLLKLVNNITEELDKGNCSIAIFIDLSKAFDTVDHTLLLRKMQQYDIRCKALIWLTSYLSDRTQYVSLNHSNFLTLRITCGVSQGPLGTPIIHYFYKRRR